MSVKSSLGITEVDVERGADNGAYIKAGFVGKGPWAASGHFTAKGVEALINELAEAIGKTATLADAPKQAELPTQPGVYIAADMAHRAAYAQIYKLKDRGWTDADGHAVEVERVQELANRSRLIRLTPEGE